MEDALLAMIPVKVDVFNGGPTDVRLSVNRGPEFVVPGVGEGQDWRPSMPDPGHGPGYDNGGPSANRFGPGDNAVAVQVGQAQTYNITVHLPNVPTISLQFYLLLRDSMRVDWVLATSGTVVASSIGTSSGAAGS